MDASGRDWTVGVQAVLRLVADTGPVELYAHVEHGPERQGGRIWIHAVAGGVTWTLSALLFGGFPDFAQVQAEAETGTLVEVDAADFRELWAPFRGCSDVSLAVYTDGSLLAWGADGLYGDGIGTTLSAIPTEAPLAVFGRATLPALAKRIPKAGKIAVRAAADEHVACMVAGEIVGRVKFERLPEYVTLALQESFEAVPTPVEPSAAEIEVALGALSGWSVA